MKAIVCTKYGTPDVLQLKEVEKPTPREDEVLVKVHAASVNAADWHLLTADIFLVRLMMGLFKQKRRVPGADIAGRVEAVGRNVKQFRPGDEVFGDILLCGSGSFAEYACAPERALALKPAKLSFEEAAAVARGRWCRFSIIDKGVLNDITSRSVPGRTPDCGERSHMLVRISKMRGGRRTGRCLKKSHLYAKL